MTKFDLARYRGLRRLWASTTGGVLIYIAFGLPILLGAMALSVDLGRAFILNTELKDYSDAAALAGAAELDGRNGAITAAYNAATTGISGNLINIQAFATDGSGPNIQVAEVVFLKNLPADGTNFTSNDTTTVDSEARFIFVKVVDRSVRSGLSRALGLIPDFETSGRSIAGFKSVTCRVPPIFMCNPLESDDTSDWTGDYDQFPYDGVNCFKSDTYPGAPLKDGCLTGRELLAKNVGNGAAYLPGNFGLLDPTSCLGLNVTQGSKCLAVAMAAFAPDNCVADTVDFRTGEAMGPIRAAINTRFDMYSAPQFNNEEGNPNYPPAKNVTKGYTGSGCSSNPTNPPTAMHLPRDSCFATDTCLGGRYGDGVWDRAGYWAVNHPGVSEPANYNNMTRYDVYRYEISKGFEPANPGGIPDNSSSGGENGKPQCYTGTSYADIPDPTDDADNIGVDETDRRLMIMAVVNCRDVQLTTGTSLQGNESNVPTIGFIKIFLVEPAVEPGGGGGGGGGSTQADMYVELAGVVQPGQTDVFRDIVQLYR